MPRQYHKYKGKILGRVPDPAADAQERAISELMKKIAQDKFLDTMTPEERKQYLAEGRRLKEISDMAIRKSQQELQSAQGEFKQRQQDKLALIGPLNQRLAAGKAQAAAAAAAAPVVSQEELDKARIERKLEADIVNYITPKYRENAETILGNFFDTVNYDEPYELGFMTPSLDNYHQIESYWINDIERRIESGELLGDGGGGGAAAMFESMDDDDDGPLQRSLDGGKKSKKSRKSKKSKKSRKARQSKRSKTRKHL
jgi:hypothetical protein